MAQNNGKLQNVYSHYIALNGDVDGYIVNCTVRKIQNHSVESGTPTDGDVLTYNSSNSTWEHNAPPTYTDYYSDPSTTPYILPVRVGSTDTTITSTDCIYVNTGNNKTVTLPQYSPIGQRVIINNQSSSTTLTIHPNSTVIGNATSTSSNFTLEINDNSSHLHHIGVTDYYYTYADCQTITLICFDGSNWIRTTS